MFDFYHILSIFYHSIKNNLSLLNAVNKLPQIWYSLHIISIMLISRKIKLTIIWASLLVLASTMLTPAQTANAAPIEESRARRYVAGLVQCLMRIDDVYGEYMTESNLGDWLGYEYAVVGLDMETPNGVVTCGTALNESSKLLANIDSASEAQVWLQNNIFPTRPNVPNPTFNSFQGLQVKTSETFGPTQIFMDSILIPYVNNIPVDARELAERMLILADFCYGYNDQDYSPSDFGNRAGTIFATQIDISQNQAADFVGLNKNNDGLTIGGLGGVNSYLAEHELKFNMRTGGNSSNGGWDGPYVSSFLPIGADNIDLVNEFSTREVGGTGRGSIQDCNIVKDLEAQYGLFDFYVLDANSKLTFDGKTAQDILDASNQDVDFNLSNEDVNPSCEGADALGWIMCPLLAGVLNLNDVIFNNFIQPFLIVDPINTNDGLVYSVWSSFRTIGNIVLVFALLFIVFGQAIGGGLVDAYTAKKAMPRIFVAAILINTSIYIVAFMVDMGNILGAGMGEMITAPAEASGNFEYRVDGIAALITIVGLIAGVLIAWIVGASIKKNYRTERAAGPDGDVGRVLLSAAFFFCFPILLVIIGIFATLIIRLGLILLLAIISPVALAMFAVPSAEKYSKKWLDLLIKSIIVYPIIVTLFAVAYLLSVMVSSGVGGVNFSDLITALIVYGGLIAVGGVIGSDSGRGGRGAALGGGLAIATLLSGAGPELGISGTSLITSFISIIILFIPLVVIPFSFKLAGGIMGSLLGTVAKARAGTDKLVRGDKHNPHGRFNKTSEKFGRKFTDDRDRILKGLRNGALSSSSTPESTDATKSMFGDGVTGRVVTKYRGRRERRRAVSGTGTPVASVSIPAGVGASKTSDAGQEATKRAESAAWARQQNLDPTKTGTAADFDTVFGDSDPGPATGPGPGGGQTPPWRMPGDPGAGYQPPLNIPQNPGQTIPPTQNAPRQAQTGTQQAQQKFGDPGYVLPGMPGQQARGSQPDEDENTPPTNIPPNIP